MTHAVALRIVETLVSDGHQARRVRKSEIVEWARRIRHEGWPEVTQEEWTKVPGWLAG